MSKRLLRTSYLLLALCLVIQPNLRACAEILVVASENSPVYREFLAAQQRRYPDSLALPGMSHPGGRLAGFLAWPQAAARSDERKQATLQVLTRAGNEAFAALCNRADVVVVAAGWEAARAAAQACAAPTLVVLTVAQQVNQLLNQPRKGALSAIFLEADPLLNLRLLRNMLPKAVTVGVLVSPASRAWLPALRAEAERLQLKLDEIAVTTDQEAVRDLRRHLEGLEAVLLLPEITVVNEWSLKPILLMTARSRLPTFGGINQNYVNAGVMAAVIANQDRLHEQIKAFVERLANGVTPPPAYPQATQVAVNRTVARTLSIQVDAVDQPVLGPSR